MFNVLCACEESQAVCMAFRDRGFNAFSCDILPCSGSHPEWHIQGDVLPLLNGSCTFYTSDGRIHHIFNEWDLIIAFPPCTYLTVTGNRWFNIERYGSKAVERLQDRDCAVEFFMMFANAKCQRIAIENPIGVMSSLYRKPNQIVHPFYFGDPARKATCLWLKGLPELYPTDLVDPVVIKYKNGKGTDNPWHMDTMNLPAEQRSILRSKTFPGFAVAMAEQWGNFLLQKGME